MSETSDGMTSQLVRIEALAADILRSIAELREDLGLPAHTVAFILTERDKFRRERDEWRTAVLSAAHKEL